MSGDAVVRSRSASLPCERHALALTGGSTPEGCLKLLMRVPMGLGPAQEQGSQILQLSDAEEFYALDRALEMMHLSTSRV